MRPIDTRKTVQQLLQMLSMCAIKCLCKQFNVLRYPQNSLSSWSLIVQQRKFYNNSKHLDILNILCVKSLIRYCTSKFRYYFQFYRGGISTEVGKRAHRLHLQGVFQTLLPTSPDACALIHHFVGTDEEHHISFAEDRQPSNVGRNASYSV